MDGNGRRALVVVNSNSRSGASPGEFIAALEAGGMTLLRRECEDRNKLADLIRTTRKDVDCVVLGGGDGTLNGAALALRDTGLPLGILPLGTGNDLARTLDIPTTAAEAAAIILAGQTRRIDLGSVNGRPFFNVASVGLTVDVTRKLDRAVKQRLGRLAYAWTAIRVLLGHKRFSAIIRCGSTIHRVRTMQVTVGNGRFYGGGMVVAADAAIDDHVLHVYSLEPDSRLSLLWMARAFRDGEHEGLPEIRTDRAIVVEVVTRLPKHVSADGEIVTVTPARFSIMPGAVTVYAPEPAPSEPATPKPATPEPATPEPATPEPATPEPEGEA